jgi:hypothetical protein
MLAASSGPWTAHVHGGKSLAAIGLRVTQLGTWRETI